MDVFDYLNLVATVETQEIAGEPWQVYVSKYDGSYITMKGLESDVQPLADNEVVDQLSHGIGFSPKYNTWFGWTHRAMFGFGIGSTCERGAVHYFPNTEQDAIADAIQFFSDESRLNVTAVVTSPGNIHVSWTYADTVPNEALRNQINGCDWNYDLTDSKGEWTAVTLDDAKRMALDFRKGAS